MDGPHADDPDAIGDELCEDLRTRVKLELAPGERLVWASRPCDLPPRPVTGFVVSGLVASFFLLGSVIFFAAFALDKRPENGFRSEIPPLIGGGLLTLAVAVFIAAILTGLVRIRQAERVKRSGTLYALTDRRAIIWLPEPRLGAVKVYTVTRGSLEGVHRLEFSDGRGDVLFRLKGQHPEVEPWGPTAFVGIAEVRRVEEEVRRTLVVSPPCLSNSDGRPDQERRDPEGERV